MATTHPLTTIDWLADMPSDTEEAPWMVMPDYQFWAIHLLVSILKRHRAERRLRWYIGSELWVTLPRPGLPNLDTAPDLFVAEGDTHSRTSWNIREEGQAPRFVLEVVTGASWERDTSQKRDIYELMGVEEYAVFAPQRKDGGPKLLGYHRGVFERWQVWQAEAAGLRSRALGGLLLNVVEAGETLLRLYDVQGRLLPSEEEARKAAVRREKAALQRAEAETQRAEDARQRADAEAQRAEEERQRADAEALQATAAKAQVAALEAELARLRNDS